MNYYRDYDPQTGRYIESDPIGLTAGSNTYTYVAANPLAFIDSLGLKPGDKFKDIDSAVIDAVRYARTLPVNHRIEYGGWIYGTPDGCYTYDEPSHSTRETGPDRLPLPAPRVKDVEWWHTHPEGDNAEDFSKRNWDGSGRPGDIGVAEEHRKAGNLGTPSGVIKKYIPSGKPGKPGVERQIKQKEPVPCGC